MARALMNASGRALSINGRGATIDCEGCCAPAAVVRMKACPCQSFLTPCAIAIEPCVFVDVRSVLSTDTTKTLTEYVNAELSCVDGTPTPPVIIRIGGVCYRLCDELYYESDTANGFLIVPDDAVRFGGPGVVLEVRENCIDGCADVNIGPEYFEAIECSGCQDRDAIRRFVCASAAGGMTVISNLSNTVFLCIDRTVGYSLAQIESLPGDIEVINEPEPLRVWTGGGSAPRYLPAPSCCFSPQRGDCNPVDCLTGRDWTAFGPDNDRWFPVDVCCGSQDGLLYRVAFGFSRVQVQEIGPGDYLTTTITATVDSVVNVSGSIQVNLTVTTIATRTGIGQTFRSDSPATITMEGKCCLNDQSGLPQMARFDMNDTPVGEQGAYYFTRSIIDHDPATARRNAWNISPWAGPFQLAFLDGDPNTTYASTGDTNPPTSCRRFDFRHTETVNYGSGGSVNVYINLVVETIPDQAFPCGFSGPCGVGGWGSDLDMVLP